MRSEITTRNQNDWEVFLTWFQTTGSDMTSFHKKNCRIQKLIIKTRRALNNFMKENTEVHSKWVVFNDESRVYFYVVCVWWSVGICRRDWWSTRVGEMVRWRHSLSALWLHHLPRHPCGDLRDQPLYTSHRSREGIYMRMHYSLSSQNSINPIFIPSFIDWPSGHGTVTKSASPLMTIMRRETKERLRRQQINLVWPPRAILLKESSLLCFPYR